MISIVIPLYNEERNVASLHKELTTALSKLSQKSEIIYVNDGSTDKTLCELKKLSQTKVITLRKNFGQTAALNAGFQNAKGEIIITLDGDLQNDPADISKLIEKIHQGFDVVSGWRKNRQDSFSKKLLSQGARQLRKIILKDTTRDSGCSLKAYRREALEDLHLFGETHRFIPAILAWQGYKAVEIPVNHRPRTQGRTKYNYKRLIKGLLDMGVVWFWYKFSDRPLYLFGGVGSLLFLAGLAIGGWMFVERFFLGMSLQNRIWPLISVFSLLAGIQLFGLGILADIGLKTYFSRNRRKTIKEISRSQVS
ncbi:MAG: glycosyltransferase family 2 protein [bacterium]